MSYSLYILQWEIIRKLDDKSTCTETKFSFHEDGIDVGKFVKKFFAEAEQGPNVQYRFTSKGNRMPQGGILKHAPGILYREVLDAKAKNVYGVWKTEDEFSLA